MRTSDELIEEAVERLDEFGSLGLVEGIAAMADMLRMYRARVERVRKIVGSAAAFGDDVDVDDIREAIGMDE